MRQQLTGAKGDLLVGAMGEALNAAERSIKTMKAAADKLRRLSKPFLNWAGKAEKRSFEVPTLPLFVHERLSTKAILETLKGHKREKQLDMFDLFGDTGHSITDQVLRAYEHKDRWVNRMILGDSLIVMNSLLQYEGMGGKVQMIYMDPPYGVKFGSNFQPFVRKRDVTHGDDEDMTREPEMVQAYRDTWELGLHSYLTYMRDRLLLSRDLLRTSGSIFVQISAENLHHVRELMDEVYKAENFCGLIAFRTTGGQSTALLSSSMDFLLWYAKDKDQARLRFHNPTTTKRGGTEASNQYTWIEPSDFSEKPRSMTDEELDGSSPIPDGWKILRPDTIYSQGSPSDPQDRVLVWEGKTYTCPPNTHWKPGVKSGGMSMVAAWSILNKVANRSDARYSDVVLVVCPNVTIRSRLSELYPETGEASVYRKRDLVPPQLMPSLRQGKVLVTNWHGFELQTPQTGGVSAKVTKVGVAIRSKETFKIALKTTTARDKKYLTPEGLAIKKLDGAVVLKEKKDSAGNLIEVTLDSQRYVESDTAWINRILGQDVGGKQNILVMNDEAHHAYRIRNDENSDDEDEDDEDYFYKEATVWVEGLDRIHKMRNINFCLDLSATPFFLGRVGQDANRPFP